MIVAKGKNKICRMCGESIGRPSRTKEHVIPDWLLDEFDLKGHQISYTPFELQGPPSLQLSLPNDETPRRDHNLGSFLLGSVCKDCNGGWMSALEVHAKPDLIRLIKDPGQHPQNPIALAGRGTVIECKLS